MSKIFERKAMTSGITLIALVITIVVIMILAGVSVAMLTGDNAIIEQASDAKRDSEIAGIKEQIENEVLRSYGENGYIDKDKLDGRLNAIGVVLDKNSSPLIASKGDYLFTIDEDGVVSIIGEEGTLAGEITAVNYGDYIDYPIDLNEDGDTTNDWRIFYNEKGNTFIIAADFVSNNSKYLKLDEIDMDVIGVYNTYWNDEPIYEEIESSVAIKFKFGINYDELKHEGEMGAVSKLLNTSAWSNLVTEDLKKSGAEAIGAPTIEMFVASWNAKGYEALYCDNSNEIGYYIGFDPKPTTSSIYLTDSDTLYFPPLTDQIQITDVWAYWIASPSTNGIMGVRLDTGLVGSYDNYWNSMALRPVVCLPATVQGKLENGIWRIQ